jgi:methyl-accepting chemotaxis protein
MKAEQREQDRLRVIEATRAMNELADNFERSVGSVVDTVSSASTELQSSAQAMSSTAEHTDIKSANVASASEQASANLETVATATAVDEANSADNIVHSLATAANKIGEVFSLIVDIAEQTILLALNATIEAARGRCR